MKFSHDEEQIKVIKHFTLKTTITVHLINNNNENITADFFNFPGVISLPSLKLNYNKMCYKNSHELYISVSELFSESSDGHNIMSMK